MFTRKFRGTLLRKDKFLLRARESPASLAEIQHILLRPCLTHLLYNLTTNYSLAWFEICFLYFFVVGVDPEHMEHSEYLDQFSNDFYQMLATRIDGAIQKKSETEVHLTVYEEVSQHITFAKSKCEFFHGRQEQLDKIKNYIKGEKAYRIAYYPLKQSNLNPITYGGGGFLACAIRLSAITLEPFHLGSPNFNF